MTIVLQDLIDNLNSGMNIIDAARKQGSDSATAKKVLMVGRCPTKELEKKSFRSFGCSVSEASAVPKKARAQYSAHKSNAANRKVEWLFNLVSWWDVWKSSGHYEERGQLGWSYCMGRFNDVGPYAPWNVQIYTNAENFKDAGKSSKKRRAEEFSKNNQAIVSTFF